MTPVPWVTTPPDLIEQIVAVLLGNRYEQSFRIRPSKGDGGLDVLVPTTEPGHFDDYQVKKFATNLGSNEKRHITESLEAAIKTHNDPDSPFLIDNWYLTLPLNPTREQYKWLADEVARLKPPFKVEWRALDFLERLAADYPKVIDYYLHDGKDRLNEQIKALRDLAKLGESETGAMLEPSDVLERLSNLRQALNGEDPHYRYDFEVTEREPDLPDMIARPYILASCTAVLPGGHVTFHVYGRYPDATWDRPIPTSFNISKAKLTPEQLEEFNNMVRYGTPMSLPDSVVSDINIDLPGGLALVDGSGSVILGPAQSALDRPSRVVWAIVPPDTIEPLAELVFEMGIPTRGISGGGQVRGVDSTGVIVAIMRFEPSDSEERTVSISLSTIDPAGKPIKQVLPGTKFLRHFHAPNRLALGPEYGLLTVAAEFTLPDPSESVPAITLECVEALGAISQRCGQIVSYPAVGEMDEEDLRHILSVGRLLRGEQVPITWSSIKTRASQETITANSWGKGILPTVQGLAVKLSGGSYDLGKFYTYLLSHRIETDPAAEPDDEGRIAVTILPDEHNQAIMSGKILTTDEIQELSVKLGIPRE